MSNMIINNMDKDWGTLIITYGLSDEQVKAVEASLPIKRCEVYKADCISDIIALPQMASIVMWNVLTQDDKEVFVDYYREMAPYIDEKVVLIGDVDVPKDLKKYLVIYPSFEELSDKMKYILLNAYKKKKKIINFSQSLSNTLMVLRRIRQKPYITTRELSEDVEMTPRTIQRYIETLRMAREFIEYDTHKKGWYLQDGKSVLLGDIFD